MKIHCLGNTGYDKLQQSGFGFIVQDDEEYLMFDCGPYALRSMQKIGLKPNDINSVFISHMHPDHCLGLPWLFNSLMMDEYYKEYTVSKKEIIIPNGKNHHVIEYIKENYGWMIGDEQICLHLDDSCSYDVGSFHLEIFPLKHSVENYGVAVTKNGYKVVYVPDFIASESPDLKNALKDADVAIISIAGSIHYRDDANQYGFSIAEDVAALANDCNVKKVLGFHLFYDDDQNAVKFEIKKTFSGKFSIPNEGDVIEVGLR